MGRFHYLPQMWEGSIKLGDKMRIKGKKLFKRAAETIVFPRADGDIVFKCGPVTNDEVFLSLCPKPASYEKILPGGRRVEDSDNPAYKKKMNDWANKKMHWMVLNSLSFTDDLEWENVSMDDPSTWGLYEQELKDSGFSEMEIGLLVNTVISACGLSQDKISEATKRFLAQVEGVLDVESSPNIELHSTTSGELVNESESDPQE